MTFRTVTQLISSFDTYTLSRYVPVGIEFDYDAARSYIWKIHTGIECQQKRDLNVLYYLWSHKIEYNIYVNSSLQEFYRAFLAYCDWMNHNGMDYLVPDKYYELLNEEQEKALYNLALFVNDETSTMCLFEGFPGTGKTFTIVQFLKYAIDQYFTIKLVAPTHKAKSVLVTFCTEQNLNLEVYTLAQMLCMRHVYENGKSVFRHLPKTKQDYERLEELETSLVIVDECSMIDEEYLLLLQSFCKKLIFIGDRNQLPPVDCTTDYSPIFNLTYDERYHIKLSKVVRNGGNILKMCEVLRENLNHLTPNITQYVDEDSVKELTLDETLELKKENKNLRFITYTNARADWLCQTIRKYLGYTSEFEIGEVVYVIDKPIVRKSGILNDIQKMICANIQDEIEITDILIQRHSIGILYYVISGINLSSGLSISFNVVCSNNDHRKTMYEHELKKEAKRSRNWQQYIEFTEFFSTVRHVHALTANASQGSTFDYVAIDYNDMIKCRNILERNQRLYVAVSRTSESLTIITA